MRFPLKLIKTVCKYQSNHLKNLYCFESTVYCPNLVRCWIFKECPVFCLLFSFSLLSQQGSCFKMIACRKATSLRWRRGPAGPRATTASPSRAAIPRWIPPWFPWFPRRRRGRRWPILLQIPLRITRNGLSESFWDGIHRRLEERDGIVYPSSLYRNPRCELQIRIQRVYDRHS